MNNHPEPLRCSFCAKEAHWYAVWRHGQPEYKVILEDEYIKDKHLLYCDDHQEHFAQVYRPVP